MEKKNFRTSKNLKIINLDEIKPSKFGRSLSLINYPTISQKFNKIIN